MTELPITPPPIDQADATPPVAPDVAAPDTPPSSPNDPEAEALLLQFVRDRDIDCPRCGYNLRNLTHPTCPECREELDLRIGVPKQTMGWLIVSLAPGLACSVAIGLFIFVMISQGPPGGPFPYELALTLLFLGASACGALVLATRNRAFLRLPNHLQIAWAGGIWIVHVLAFAIFWNSI